MVLPEQDYGVMYNAINHVILEKGLQPEPSTFVKITQLYETMIVRHGVMTVGPTGGGKTTVLNVSAQNKSKDFVLFVFLTESQAQKSVRIS